MALFLRDGLALGNATHLYRRGHGERREQSRENAHSRDAHRMAAHEFLSAVTPGVPACDHRRAAIVSLDVRRELIHRGVAACRLLAYGHHDDGVEIACQLPAQSASRRLPGSRNRPYACSLLGAATCVERRTRRRRLLVADDALDLTEPQIAQPQRPRAA